MYHRFFEGLASQVSMPHFIAYLIWTINVVVMARTTAQQEGSKRIEIEVDPETDSIAGIVATGFSSWADVEELISDLAMTELPTAQATLISETGVSQ